LTPVCRLRKVAAAALLIYALQAEVLDRVAVTVGRHVITQSEIIEQIRVAAFLNDEEPDLSAAGRKKASERLVEQTLIRTEMALSRYPEPSPAAVEKTLAEVKRVRQLSDAAFAGMLARHKLTEEVLRRNLANQLMILLFIDYRFRPSVAVPNQDVEKYYRESFVPEWKKSNSQDPPELDEVWDGLMEKLRDQRTDEALEEWLREARKTTRVTWVKEAFQ